VAGASGRTEGLVSGYMVRIDFSDVVRQELAFILLRWIYVGLNE
jgi:hypothetical protein